METKNTNFKNELYENRISPPPAFSDAVDLTLMRIAASEGSRRSAPVRQRRGVYRVLLPIAAALIVLFTLFSIPAVSQAVQNWFNDLFRVEKYMRAGRDEAEENADIEQAIQQIGPAGQQYEILLLNEIPATEHYSYAGIDEWRVKLGQPAFAEADWDWIRDIVPEVREVLYDGKNLIVNLFYKTDPVPFARGYLVGMKTGTPSCDILCLDYRLTVDGEEIPQYSWSTGLDFSKWYPRMQEEGFTVESVREDGGVHGQVIIEFPDMPALPDGICEAEFVMSVQDAYTDDMGIVGMVAEIIHRFSFDTTAGNAQLSSSQGAAHAFSGAGTVTLFHYGDLVESSDAGEENYWIDMRGNPIDPSGEQWVENRAVDLAGLCVTPVINRRATGVSISLPYECPEDWEYDLQNAVMRAIEYELIVDGISQGMVFSGGYLAAPTIEVSLTESELKSATSIVLRPYISHYAAWDPGVPMPVGTRIDLAAYDGAVTEPEIVQTPLENCDIVIPLD